MRSLLFSTILGSVLLTSSLAHAEAWLIEYTTVASPFNTVANVPDSGSLLVFTDNTLVNGATTVIGISGERDGLAITGLSPYAASDQLLFEVTPFFDLSGVSFTDSNNESFNLFSSGGNYELSSAIDSVGYPGNGVALATLSVTDVPEPASLAVLGAGMIGVGAIRRKRAAL